VLAPRKNETLDVVMSKYKTANGAIRDILQTVSKCTLVLKYLNVYTVHE